MEYVKKTKTGYRPATVANGQYTHIVMASEEYDNLQDQVAHAREEADLAMIASEEKQQYVLQSAIQLKQMYRDLQAEIQQIRLNAQVVIDYNNKRLAQLQAEKKALEEQLKRSEKSLENCLRVGRERANAQRNLRPKKEHPGYVLLSSQQWAQTYKEESPEPGYESRTAEWLRENLHMIEERKTVEVWKSVLQTPYDACIEYQFAKDHFEKDLAEKDLLADLGCQAWIVDGSDDSYRDFGHGEDGELINAIYKYKFKSNYRTGLWEVELYSNLPLRVSTSRWI